MICWFCYWGWPKPIRDIYDRAKADIDLTGEDGYHCLHFGPAHVVWEDENFDFAEDCLVRCSEERELPPEVVGVIERSLRELAALPDIYKTPPTGYDENSDPADFPPPKDWTMVC